MIPFTPADAKSAARALRTALSPHVELSHGQALDVVARASGLADWNALAARYATPGAAPVMPILRMFDVPLARRFYVDWLGFHVDFEHRFEDDLPLFMGLSIDDARVALSEHHGDGTPGTAVWIPTRSLAAYRERIVAASGGRIRSGIDPDAPGGPTMSIADPFGNHLRFCEPERPGG